MSFESEISALGLKVSRTEPMSRHTTLGIGGPAEWYAEPSTAAQLRGAVDAARARGVPLFFLGAGSNLLVSDAGIGGLVLRLRGEFEAMSWAGNEVRAGAGVFLPTLVKQCAERGLGGAEPLVGIPGTVGGALAMNAGTRDLEIGAIVKTVEVLGDAPGSPVEVWPAERVRFQYRWSSLVGKIACFATLKLKAGNKDDIIRTIQEFLSRRLQTQPIGTQNVGSIFKNPEGKFAAQLIEQAGLKGLKRGGAQVSPKHANFIINAGGATAGDVRGLILEIQSAVEGKFGVKLEPEVKMVGK